jgi:hypothetical protein
MAPVTTGQIYWGAIPFVIIQLIMVGLVIVFPEMVLVYKKDASTVDPNSIEMTFPTEGGTGGAAPPAEGSSGLQNYAPAPDQGYGSGAPATAPPDDAPRHDAPRHRPLRHKKYSARRCRPCFAAVEGQKSGRVPLARTLD